LTYDKIREHLRTGDIVLFSGKGAVASIIKLTTGKWSHVGMVVRVRELLDAVFLWESTTLSSIADLESGRAVKGVQLVPLSQRLATYNGEVRIRQLSRDISRDMELKLHACRRELSRRPYERSQAELFKAAWDGIGGQNHPDLSSVFCSELVAEAYQAMGLLPRPPVGAPANEYTPADFSDRGVGSGCMLLGYSLGPERPVAAAGLQPAA
jgi:hypothetical protein